MSKVKYKLTEVKSVTQAHRFFGLPNPLHPLISIIKIDDVDFSESSELWKHYVTDLYSIALKKGETSKLKYGQTEYDFDEGIMTLIAPKQVMSMEDAENFKVTGYHLIFHPDFLMGYTLAKTIKEYGFFSYSNSKALFLSDKEEELIVNLFKSIESEYQNNIDKFSQDVMIANIELLLVHIDRYFTRQFITRKNIANDSLSKMEDLLQQYFEKHQNELPTVQLLANEMNVSPGYLSDMLKSLTGLTAQQHIHEKLLEKAKELLTSTNLTVGEIAFQLGFEHPQSFNKLFKNKVKLSPLEFRASFN